MKLTGRWFPQIVGQWESISNIYITKIVVLVSEPVRGRSRATELWASDHWVASSNPLRGSFVINFASLSPASAWPSLA